MTRTGIIGCGVLALLVGCAADREVGSSDVAADGASGEDATPEADVEPAPDPPLEVIAVHPGLADPLGGSRLTVTGRGFGAGVGGVEIGGVPATDLAVVSDGTLRFTTGAMPAGAGYDLVVVRGARRATLAGAIDAWSPAEIDGARLFDAAAGVTTDGPATHYEWQRLTPDMGADWRVRDGNTTTWHPPTRRFWMVAGWNGMQAPEGFSSVPPETVSPPENTTDEVWSSPDGVTWTLALPHGHGQFERRHAHNAMLWRDRLWLIGGDYHQGKYNHDVVSSADGVTWTVVLGPGAAAPPPWSGRVLQVSGVYDGALWTAGGQDVVADLDQTTFHNDVWRSDDGEHWVEVAPDAPASETRWAGCGVLDGLAEFKGRMWLVGCARERADAQGHSMSNAVWSTQDGITWRRHATPPWQGKIWHNVVAWDGRLWILFGFTYGDPANGWPIGNANEVWSSDDGETWSALPHDSPVPGSHAQGLAVTDDFLLLAGGNYSFGFGAGPDKSAWRLVPFRGQAVTRWTDRGGDALAVAPPLEVNRPVWVPDGLGAGVPGLQLDGATSVLALEGEPDVQPAGRSIFWVARAPWVPLTSGWVELYNPAGTVVGGAFVDGYPLASAGLTEGRLAYVNREAGLDDQGTPRWASAHGGDGLQVGAGQVHLMGITHALDGTVRFFVDGREVASPAALHYGSPRAWSRIGGGLDGAGEGPANRFAGTLGAVVVLATDADEATVARLHAWSQGRFGTP